MGLVFPSEGVVDLTELDKNYSVDKASARVVELMCFKIVADVD